MKELRAGCGGLGQDKAAAKRVRDMLVALQQRQDGPAPEVFVLLNYVNGSLESRRELLTGPLFVRCAAAVLDGRYTGELQVDASAAGGCEVDKVAAALRLNLGETMYNPTGKQVAAQDGHKRFFTAFTLLSELRGSSLPVWLVVSARVRLHV